MSCSPIWRQVNDLEKLVERAEPAGQNGKSVGAFEHDLFALVHAVDKDGLAEPAMLHFGARQMVRNDADNLALGSQHGIGHFGHQADAAGAIHQRDTARRNFAAERAGQFRVACVVASAGAAIDAQRLDPIHAPVIQRSSAGRQPGKNNFAAAADHDKMIGATGEAALPRLWPRLAFAYRVILEGKKCFAYPD